MSAKINKIFIGPVRGGPMDQVESVMAMEGKGLAGDRYSIGEGSYSKSRGIRDVTLIEIESLWDFFRQSGIDLHPSLSRRNLLTEGVRLKDLIGKQFFVGEVELKGLRVCPPCGHLARLVGIPDIVKDLAESGGIYAEIVEGGVIRKDDPIVQDCD